MAIRPSDLWEAKEFIFPYGGYETNAIQCWLYDGNWYLLGGVGRDVNVFTESGSLVTTYSGLPSSLTDMINVNDSWYVVSTSPVTGIKKYNSVFDNPVDMPALTEVGPYMAGLTWDGTFFYVLGGVSSNQVWKYTEDFTYTGEYFDLVGLYGYQGVHFYDSSFWFVGKNDASGSIIGTNVKEYDSNFNSKPFISIIDEQLLVTNLFVDNNSGNTYITGRQPDELLECVGFIPQDKTTCLTPESKADITTGDLLPAESKTDIVTGDLLSAESSAGLGGTTLLTASAIVGLTTDLDSMFEYFDSKSMGITPFGGTDGASIDGNNLVLRVGNATFIDSYDSAWVAGSNIVEDPAQSETMTGDGAYAYLIEYNSTFGTNKLTIINGVGNELSTVDISPMGAPKALVFIGSLLYLQIEFVVYELGLDGVSTGVTFSVESYYESIVSRGGKTYAIRNGIIYELDSDFIRIDAGFDTAVDAGGVATGMFADVDGYMAVLVGADAKRFSFPCAGLVAEDIEHITTGDLLPAESKADIVTGDLLAAEVKADIVTGDLLLAESKIDIVTGDLLTAIPLPPTSGFPLNYARIGYDNALVNGSASATSDTVNAAKMLTPSTYDKWRPTADSVATLVGTLKQCNYVGIAAHNLGADGVTLTVKVSDGGAYTTVYSQLVTTNNALFIRFAEGAYSNVELTLTGSLTAEIGVVFLGLELEMMRPIFTGHKPANLNATDVMTPQVSDGGQFLGKQIVRQGYATAADFQHLTDEWYRDKFQPFVEHAKVRPYFWAWNLLESPDDIVYGWTNSNIGCSYMGIRNWLQVSFDIEAHA